MQRLYYSIVKHNVFMKCKFTLTRSFVCHENVYNAYEYLRTRE